MPLCCTTHTNTAKNPALLSLGCLERRCPAHASSMLAMARAWPRRSRFAVTELVEVGSPPWQASPHRGTHHAQDGRRRGALGTAGHLATQVQPRAHFVTVPWPSRPTPTASRDETRPSSFALTPCTSPCRWMRAKPTPCPSLAWPQAHQSSTTCLAVVRTPLWLMVPADQFCGLPVTPIEGKGPLLAPAVAVVAPPPSATVAMTLPP